MSTHRWAIHAMHFGAYSLLLDLVILPGAARYPVTIYHLEEGPISGSHRSYCMRGYSWRGRLTNCSLFTASCYPTMIEAESESAKHRHQSTHTVRITQSLGRQLDIRLAISQLIYVSHCCVC